MLDMKQRQSILGSDDGLSTGRHQAITCTSVGNCQLYYQGEASAKFKSLNGVIYAEVTSWN